MAKTITIAKKNLQRHGVPKFCCDVLTFQLIRFFFNLLTPAEEDLGSPKLGSKLMFLMDRANFSFSLLKFFFSVFGTRNT